MTRYVIRAGHRPMDTFWAAVALIITVGILDVVFGRGVAIAFVSALILWRIALAFFRAWADREP